MKNIFIVLMSNNTWASGSSGDFEPQLGPAGNSNSLSRRVRYSFITLGTIAAGVGIYYMADHFVAQNPRSSSAPTGIPTGFPSALPSYEPSTLPTGYPSNAPSLIPSSKPSMLPTVFPSETPSSEPSVMPSVFPSETPSSEPSVLPTVIPSEAFSSEPSKSNVPSQTPSLRPSLSPSLRPSLSPSAMPSQSPSLRPSLSPSIAKTWKQTGSNIDGNKNEMLGVSVAISNDGRILAVGAPHNDATIGHPTHTSGKGKVRVYLYDVDNWKQLGLDIVGGHDDYSGQSVSLSADGYTLIVGSPLSRENGIQSGRVTAYNYNGTDWDQLGDSIYGEQSFGRFGYSTASSSDGKTIIIGGPFSDHNGPNTGSVKAFHFNGTDWNQLGHRLDGDINDIYFGHSVSISDDGNTIAIGAPESLNQNKRGSVEVYHFDGNDWILQGDVLIGYFDSSGASVSLSSDGKTIAIGAPLGSPNKVRIYYFNGISWIQVGNNISGDGVFDKFGYSLSLSSDGTTVAIGAPRNGGKKGQVKIYKYNGAEWKQVGDDLSGESTNDNFGKSIAITEDGKSVAIGAYGSSVNGVISGQVKVYEFN